MLLVLLFITPLLAKVHYIVELQCPHDTRQDAGFTHSSIDMPPVELSAVQTTTVESSCPFEMHPIRRVLTSVKHITWAKKTTTSETTNAGASTYEAKVADSVIQGLCSFDTATTNRLAFARKGLTCLEYSCNITHCIPTIHVVIPQVICQTIRSCTLTWNGLRVLLNFERTFCPHGIVVSGNCFQPLYNAKNIPQHADLMDLEITCFLTNGKLSSVGARTSGEKILVELEKFVGKTCTDHSFFAYYTCFFIGYSVTILVPQSADMISVEVLEKMVNNTYGEDHDRVGDGQNALRIAGKTDITIKESHDKVEGVCYSGPPLYTSTYQYPKLLDNKNIFLLTQGIIPRVNYTECDKKALPVVWRGLVSVPGYIEKIDPCKVFCTLTGPGASCEAFSPTGIFNISSPTCLIGKLHRYKQLEDQITFVCQRVDQDIIVYCNGQKKVVKTETLVIGQCIYSVTSLLSLMPKIAHSIAVEVCVTGFHGWAALMLLITFCFGWLIIPTLTWLILQLVKLILIILNKHTGTSRWKQLLEKIKDEFNHTVGSTTCKTCLQDTICSEELSAHTSYCEKGICPYCLKDIGQSPVLLCEHFKSCLLSDKFMKKIKDTAQKPSQTSLMYRKVNAFRYKNRCFIFLTWSVLLIIESFLWAATATPIQTATEPKQWTDTAHGVGYVPLQLDYELDFTLPSGSGYTHKRILTDPKNSDRHLPFTVSIERQRVEASVQMLGRWLDADLNVKSVFHCYGACNKYSYPWQYAQCSREVDFEYQSAWNCNPGDCPGVGTGCTACAVFLDKLSPKATAVKLLNIKYIRKVCVQLGTEQGCKDLESTDCFTTNNVKVCITGTASMLQQGDTLIFLGPLDQGAVLVKQWCTSSCKFGDPGDLIDKFGHILCPQLDGAIQKVCAFATEPHCTFQGNTVSGFKRFMSTRDSFISVNMTQAHLSTEQLTWLDTTTKIKDHVNVVVSKDVDFEELSENPCVVDPAVVNIEGSWGSGIGFKLTCSVSLTECSSFLTTIKACDNAMCYGGTVASLDRGSNQVIIQGRGGHSGSAFKCCHDRKCSSQGIQASAPHLERVEDSYMLTSQLYDDGAPSCSVTCWFSKVGEWLTGLFTGNWWVVLILCAVAIGSLVLFTLLCPVRRHYKVS
uniref:Envelopment polyprotein n=1 Tax=Hantaviridae sp. TaxID=2809448 RepID=A0AAT9TV13_9VIRU|nr:MAG: envelope glycoprotein [Hantaviridae sp.]